MDIATIVAMLQGDAAMLQVHVAELQMQFAAMQADMTWTTRLLWAMLTLNGAALLSNGLVLRNSKKGKQA